MDTGDADTASAWINQPPPQQPSLHSVCTQYQLPPSPRGARVEFPKPKAPPPGAWLDIPKAKAPPPPLQAGAQIDITPPPDKHRKKNTNKTKRTSDQQQLALAPRADVAAASSLGIAPHHIYGPAVQFPMPKRPPPCAAKPSDQQQPALPPQANVAAASSRPCKPPPLQAGAQMNMTGPPPCKATPPPCAAKPSDRTPVRARQAYTNLIGRRFLDMMDTSRALPPRSIQRSAITISRTSRAWTSLCPSTMVSQCVIIRALSPFGHLSLSPQSPCKNAWILLRNAHALVLSGDVFTSHL